MIARMWSGSCSGGDGVSEPARVELFDHAPHAVVDDDRACATSSPASVEHGYRVTTASSAAEARAKSENFVFDALVLDVMMPGETG
jgi:two-component system phosphate regulon response regulator OmpR